MYIGRIKILKYRFDNQYIEFETIFVDTSAFYPMKLNSKYIIAAVTLVIISAILYFFREIVSYVIIAWVISMIGAPMVKFLRKYLGKNLAAGITLGAFTLIFILVLYIFVPPLISQVKNISHIDYTKVIKSIEQPLSDWESWLIDKNMISIGEETSIDSSQIRSENDYVFDQDIKIDSIVNPYDSSIMKNINLTIKIDASELMHEPSVVEEDQVKSGDFFEKLKENIAYYISPQHIQDIFTSTVSTFGNIIIGIASIFFIAFFFLREQGLFFNMVKAAVPNNYENQTMQAIDQTSKLLIRYFSGILMQMFIITLFVSIALTFLGIKNALLIGFFAAMMNVIPYVGPIIGATFGIIITLSSNLDADFYDVIVPQLSKVVIVFAIMQALDNFVLQPTIFSKSVKAHPLEIFIIVLVGAQIGGVMGMVLAIPVYTAFRVIGKVFLSEFKVIQQLTKNL